MHEQLWFTAFLNKILAAPALALLNALHIQPADPAHPISNPVSMQIFVVLLLLVMFLVVRGTLSVANPGRIQMSAEWVHGFIDGLAHDIIGHGHRRFVPFIAALGLFLLVSNLLGLIPGFLSPTQFAFVPLGCAFCTWVYYHSHGIQKQGLPHYIKHFCGPVFDLPLGLRLVMIPLMFLIEIISHTARLMSLTIRLYANMFAGDMITLAFFSLVPIGVPLIFLGLHFFVAILQAFIFIMLTTIYLAGAVGEAH
jgi:F-type H+-transporting ATPase subunit a